MRHHHSISTYPPPLYAGTLLEAVPPPCLLHPRHAATLPHLLSDDINGVRSVVGMQRVAGATVALVLHKAVRAATTSARDGRSAPTYHAFGLRLGGGVLFGPKPG